MIRLITGVLIVVTIFAWGLWDIVAISQGENATISVFITDWSRQVPQIAVLAGILIGHWFFPAKGSEDE